jgi:alpha-ketoglutarate-dependent taurine dioxygenase
MSNLGTVLKPDEIRKGDLIFFRTNGRNQINHVGMVVEILGDETAPFGDFNIFDKGSQLNDANLISSVAVVPHYFAERESKVRIEKSKSQDVMPMDVVVRVDVSPWSNPSAFAIFADGASTPTHGDEQAESIGRRMTSD